MLQTLLTADRKLLLLINGHHNAWWDSVMSFVSGKAEWIPFYILLLLILYLNKKNRLWLFLLFVALTVFMTDMGSVHLFKNVFQRLRPCHEPELEGLLHLVNGRCGGLYGFISSHAANSFGVATVLSLFYRKGWWVVLLVFWAALVSYSRIYLGVHYPGDVMGGAAWGVLCGWGVWKLYEWSGKKFPFVKGSGV